MAYTEVTIAGYNAGPPPDDGSEGASNQVTWTGIKVKLGDPLKDAINSIDDNVAAADAAQTVALAAQLVIVQGSLYAPAGTKALFVQTAAPTLWTKDTTHNNKALRLVTGTASTGGSTAFTSVLASRTILEANLPSHSHGSGTLGTDSSGSHAHSSVGNGNNISYTAGANTITLLNTSGNSTGSGGNHNHDVNSGSTASTGSGTAMDFDVQYVDVIIATKDA